MELPTVGTRCMVATCGQLGASCGGPRRASATAPTDGGPPPWQTFYPTPAPGASASTGRAPEAARAPRSLIHTLLLSHMHFLSSSASGEHRGFDRHGCSRDYLRDVQLTVCPLCEQPVPGRPDEDPNLRVRGHAHHACRLWPGGSCSDARVHLAGPAHRGRVCAGAPARAGVQERVPAGRVQGAHGSACGVPVLPPQLLSPSPVRLCACMQGGLGVYLCSACMCMHV